MSQARSLSRSAWFLLLAAMALTVAVYRPSLYGGYIFDDTIYFVNNTDVHVTTRIPGDWVRAALQQWSSHNNQFRALSMLSFAANYYFTGLDPFWPKLTNLVIHLVNGLLLFLLMRELFRLRQRVAPRADEAIPFEAIAAAIAGIWLLLPINFTGVAYVAQRMESLANIFIFLGLFGYLRLRQRAYAGASGAPLVVCLLACTALAYGAKETGVMLPLYTACIELALTRFRNADGRLSRAAVWTHGILLGLPLVVGLAWLAPGLFADHSHVRTFTLGERLLTEPRVLVDYIGWSLLPNINALAFYHDDIHASHGLLDPPATLAAILALLALLGFALWWRRTMPLFCLGILWFFAGHVLTATVIMLELVFEHRNYFASAGLLLAVASLLAIEPGLRLPLARKAIAGAFIAACAFTTFLRAQEWSNPLRLAYAEALKQPDSPRAQYELARALLLVADKTDNVPLLKESGDRLERIAMRPDSGIAPLQALIFLHRHEPQKIDPRWWQAISEKLRSNAPSQTDINAVIFLFHCQRDGDCPTQTQEMLDVFMAALDATDGNVNLMSAYADFALGSLGDAALAERMARAVVAAQPDVPGYRANLVATLIGVGKLNEAEAEIDRLASLNRAGSLDGMISNLRSKLAEARAARQGAPAPAAE
ncbi:MAG: hypothetical protein QM661_12910 [Solimonas sp.]